MKKICVWTLLSLAWTLSAGAGAALAQEAPRINFIWADEPQGILGISGEFGADPGVSQRGVTVGGTSLSVRSWEENLLQCDLPPSGAGSSGDVIVTAGGLRSNARRLAEWQGQLTYRIRGEGTVGCDFVGNVRFRGETTRLDGMPGGGKWMEITKDSSLTWSCSGNTIHYCQENSANYFSWEGYGTLAADASFFPGPPSTTGRHITFWARLNHDTGQMEFTVMFETGDELIFHDLDCEDGSLLDSQTSRIQFDEALYDVLDTWPKITTPRDEKFNVPAGCRGPVQAVYPATLYGETVEFCWTTLATTPPSELKAIPNAASTVVRGEPLTLDGTQSTGNIQEYQWTFKGSKGATKTGATVTAVFLKSTKVTLTVSDGTKKDKATILVTVLPRDWKTPFQHLASEGTLDESAPVYDPRYPSRRTWVGGENVCSYDPPQDSSEPTHILHPESANDTWDGVGYDLKQVDDPGGPHHQWWYVESYKLDISRQSLINKYIVENGPTIFGMLENFYQANIRLHGEGKGTDVVGYLKAVRDHEKKHSTIIENALPGKDPALKIEALSDKNGSEKLKKKADGLITKAEKALSKATKDPLPRMWSGSVAVPNNETYEWVVIATDI